MKLVKFMNQMFQNRFNTVRLTAKYIFIQVLFFTKKKHPQQELCRYFINFKLAVHLFRAAFPFLKF